MDKITLLSRIQKLSSIIHSNDISQYNLSAKTLDEIKRTLDEATDQYIQSYC